MRKGEIALHNKPANKDLLAQILKEAWPEGAPCLHGTSEYYYRYSRTDWTGANLVGLNAVPMSYFIEQEIESEYQIGGRYEFSAISESWHKGTLIGTIDHEFKYIALIDGNNIPISYRQIRPIKPVKIVRWVNVDSDGRVIRRSWATKEEAQAAAGHNNWKQAKLEGVIE